MDGQCCSSPAALLAPFLYLCTTRRPFPRGFGCRKRSINTALLGGCQLGKAISSKTKRMTWLGSFYLEDKRQARDWFKAWIWPSEQTKVGQKSAEPSPRQTKLVRVRQPRGPALHSPRRPGLFLLWKENRAPFQGWRFPLGFLFLSLFFLFTLAFLFFYFIGGDNG